MHPCRLLHDISKVDRALGFWAARLKAGQHRSFLLLGQGPTSFLLDILAVVTRKTDRRNHLSATDQIERRVCFSNPPPYTGFSSSWDCLILSQQIVGHLRGGPQDFQQTLSACLSTTSAVRVILFSKLQSRPENSAGTLMNFPLQAIGSGVGPPHNLCRV